MCKVTVQGATKTRTSTPPSVARAMSTGALTNRRKTSNSDTNLRFQDVFINSSRQLGNFERMGVYGTPYGQQFKRESMYYWQ
ncbi:hypothetical protein IHE44_0001087 [Lamprotornis superbus]|uniref:Uncharacterized protein n=1 Tax=Lamprotornis superbus TaxID=245042 RepID=A0A835NQE9_9PASS|nr:hypothetical protein IHE44_0001087 [Lamprotornis superbus]